ncbi:ABC transporter substrate-binding protein [Comamonas endophytica]|uniref:Helical backbone metal receptor n=1 Tax=Comamonas endophytica TaxID=2949090 RepID=A0ABY6G8Z2_9BURK|nr:MULTISPECIES: helical backbone metal receptor [unclassified Acidovorax]MCD2511801.1 helical backbone metal receptor [Acidovorax sp. D4N7]UYG51524.1 helical backbone metal receptor [Acidovorax sp. 5MLIR]
MRRRAVALALAACTLAGPPVPALAYGVRDMQGRTVEIARVPQRIVSLLPSVTESLCALSGCARLVGVDRFSNHPPQAKSLPRLGTVLAPQLEAIVRLRPDVVLMSHSPPLMAQLAKFGIPVLVLDAHDLAGMRAQWQVLDALLQQERTDALFTRLQAQLDQTAAAARGAAGRSVYFEVDATPYAAGAGSFIGELLAALGARNIAPPELGPFPRLTPEYVVRRNPQVIIHTPETPARAFAQRPGWSAVDAVRSGRICTLSSAETDLVSRPGPRLGEAAAVLARCLWLSPRRPQ